MKKRLFLAAALALGAALGHADSQAGLRAPGAFVTWASTSTTVASQNVGSLLGVTQGKVFLRLDNASTCAFIYQVLTNPTAPTNMTSTPQTGFTISTSATAATGCPSDVALGLFTLPVWVYTLGLTGTAQPTLSANLLQQ